MKTDTDGRSIRAMPPWEFERDGEVVRIEPTGPLLVPAPLRAFIDFVRSSAAPLAVRAAKPRQSRSSSKR